jgi:hypothetical protein
MVMVSTLWDMGGEELLTLNSAPTPFSQRTMRPDMFRGKNFKSFFTLRELGDKPMAFMNIPASYHLLSS